MKFDIVRSSAVKAFKGCQMRHFLEYILGIPTKSMKAAEIGTAAHKLFELLGHAKLAKQSNKRVFYDDELETKYSVKELLSSHESLIEPIWDFYLPHGDKQDRKKYDEVIEKGIQTIDPRTLHIIKLEQFFELPCPELNITLCGTMDLVTQEEDCIRVIDYKSSRNTDEFETGKKRVYRDFYDDFQLLFYAYCTRQLYDTDNLIISIAYLKLGIVYDLVFTDFDKVKERVLEQIERIRKCKRPRCNKSWRCSRMCHFGKNSFEGDELTICETVEKFFNYNGLKKTIEKFQESEYTYQRGK